MKKYKVHIECDMYVYGEDTEDASSVAIDVAEGNQYSGVKICDVEPLDDATF